MKKKIKEKPEWIVIDLNPERDLLQGLVAKLYDSNAYIRSFIMTNINLSKFGIGMELQKARPVADLESALEIILREITKKKKRLLVTIDEVSNTPYMREFTHTFQIMIRQNYPIYLIMAGLYENIQNLENEDSLTFLYRSPKYEMDPLNITLVKQKYKNIFGISEELAFNMAAMTKGYPFAYQALGKYVWEDAEHILSEDVLARFDAALEQYVYDKIWSELSAGDKYYLSCMSESSVIKTGELLKKSGKKQNEFSQYRSRLHNKGLIDISEHGTIKLVLPRFEKFIKMKSML